MRKNSCHLIIIQLKIIILALFFSLSVECRLISKVFDDLSLDSSNNSDVFYNGGEKWAILIAGSSGYENYRHQADVCHAYQLMKKGGLKDENIIVFMYDDIAFNVDNPHQGVIINRPVGRNVYTNVPKDYTGKNLTTKNLFAAILGDKKAIKGGSGKVLDSGPNDHIFIYYSDHGSAGMLGMPQNEPAIYAKDFIEVLKKKHASNTYKSMVIYIEACESGSIFDGVLPNNLSIFATTASNPNESSYATYCGGDPGIPSEYNNTCLGDLYSISWMEDSERKDPRNETLRQQFAMVKNRTSEMSHVIEYGDVHLSSNYLSLYIALESRKPNQTYSMTNQSEPITPLYVVEQREADLIYFKEMVRRAPEGSKQKIEAQKRLDEVTSHRKHVDQTVQAIANQLFGESRGPSYLTKNRPAGTPLVDDWDCFKAMVSTYEEHCGSLQSYGKKYARAFANFCNAGIYIDRMAQVSAQVCAK
ncbi:vacuolar-processing enzyme gamma-isozyme-like [Chenopodium quinoa]|uniref:vacuolar-processing enzyme gamma-isozyme-like n=1 Tax=Chenopodium quinoa TaxID=63459 RepID=UPI000B7761BC|nr:vacuolar-processing enzyme gamma-isozyme-like [Chenopodium quinoa]